MPEAIRKGEAAAKKNMHKVALKGTTIPHEIVGKYGAGAVPVSYTHLDVYKRQQLVRSAGNMAQLMAKENGYALVRLPSGEMRNVPVHCTAVIGQVSNIDHENVNLGKAGRKRPMGVRPGSRGTVMNPCDHPHGCLLYTSPTAFSIATTALVLYSAQANLSTTTRLPMATWSALTRSLATSTRPRLWLLC